MSFEIAGAVQSYEWGALGPKSKVAHYAKGLPDFQYDEKKPYAEVRLQLYPLRVVVRLMQMNSSGWARTPRSLRASYQTTKPSQTTFTRTLIC